MQILLILLALFIVWLAWGACASAKTVARGVDRVREQWTLRPAVAATEARGANQDCIQDLKSLFGLYQSGALTREEFEQAKRHLLAGMRPYA